MRINISSCWYIRKGIIYMLFTKRKESVFEFPRQICLFVCMRACVCVRQLVISDSEL